MTQLYDHEFYPFTIDGDRRIVASEDEWRRVRAFARKNGAARVRVPVDVFGEAGKAKVYNGDGRQLFISSHGGWSVEETGNPWVMLADVRRRQFDLIDEYPNVTWLLETSHPENVAVMMPEALTCQPAYGTCKRLKGHAGQHSQQPEYLPNLWLYARVDTQSEADARIPHLLRCPAAVYGVVMEPKELIRFGDVPGFNKCGSAGQELLRRFHVIIRGGAEPMHPDHVRSIIRQCEAAGVPVWCESPVDGRAVKQLPEGLK